MSFYKVSYYAEPDSHGRNKIKDEFGFPNYARKADLKGTRGVDISNLGQNRM